MHALDGIFEGRYCGQVEFVDEFVWGDYITGKYAYFVLQPTGRTGFLVYIWEWRDGTVWCDKIAQI